MINYAFCGSKYKSGVFAKILDASLFFNFQNVNELQCPHYCLTGTDMSTVLVFMFMVKFNFKPLPLHVLNVPNVVDI